MTATWHLDSTRPASSLRVGPATSSLRPDGSSGLRVERDVTIEIAPNVYSEIARLCAESPDLETGGALVSEGLSFGTTITVAHATPPGRSFRRRRDALIFDPLDDALADDHVIGIWHSHPSGGDRLSAADLGAFRRMRHGGRRPLRQFISLIVTPAKRGGWKKPALAGWVVGDDYHRRARLSMTADRSRATRTAIDPNSMYVAVESFSDVVDGERVAVEGGRDYVAGCHELVRRHPARFRLAPPRRRGSRRRRYTGEIR